MLFQLWGQFISTKSPSQECENFKDLTDGIVKPELTIYGQIPAQAFLQSRVKAHIACIVFWKHLCPNLTHLCDFHPAAEASMPPQLLLVLIACKLHSLSTIATTHQQ